ncbi:uncharacterized protein FYW49_012401 [Xenentodon cancila]
MRRKRNVSHICWLLLAALQVGTPSSAQVPVNAPSSSTPDSPALSYSTLPADVTVAVGEPAVFRCGVPEASPNLTFILYRSQKNYSLTCPKGHVEDIPQALEGSCDLKNGESLAVWTLKETTYSDNGTRVLCQQSKNPDAPAAVLHVYDTGTSYTTLVGCLIGGFFGILLVFGLLFLLLRRSTSFQNCFGASETEDDMDTIVPKD